jgi:type IV pilus biogenesis protein CpaD/CtpE
MKQEKYWAAAFALALAASGCAFANVATDNVIRSAVTPSEPITGNECTNKTIKPFARPKDSTLSDDMLRGALTLITGFARGSIAGAATHVCGDRSAL